MKSGKASPLQALLALSLVFGCAPSHASIDKTGRITGFIKTTAANTPADTATFQYGANGNRKSSTRETAGTTTSRTYSGEASHNRLLGFNQTTSAGGNSASTSVTYQYNSAGDLLSDGLTSYHYDSEGRLDSATTGGGADAPHHQIRPQRPGPARVQDRAPVQQRSHPRHRQEPEQPAGRRR